MTTLAPPEIEQRTIVSNKICPNWNVIFLNDDVHSFEFVIFVICTVFRKELEDAYRITKSIHETGQEIVTTCSKERAELYLEQVAGIKEGPKGAIGCVIEPAE